jgi:hypothetical protein
MTSVRRTAAALATLALTLVTPVQGHALELFKLADHTLRLDITASTTAAWNLDNRNSDVTDDDYGALLNRINVQLSWWRLIGAVRVDTAAYVNAPDAETLAAKTGRDPNSIWDSLRSLQRNSIWLGKAFLTYASPEVEVSGGDSYVSLGRGLVLSMRKQDELALDNTLLGGKVVMRVPNFTLTAVAGVANPSRVDEATGAGLFDLDPSPSEAAQGLTSVPIFEADRLVGGKAEATWQGASLSLEGVRMLRPDTLGEHSGIRGARTVDVGGGAISVALPKGIGAVYLEGAYQRRQGVHADRNDYDEHGFAFYGSLSAGWGPINGVVELQHYRDFDPLMATIDPRHAGAFVGLQYSAPPTTEQLITDTRYGSFDRCVTGGRAKVGGRARDWLLLWGAVGYWQTWGERNSQCLHPSYGEPERDDVVDAALGLELYFDDARSRVFASTGLRRDAMADLGSLFYREFHVELSATKAIVGPWSLELEGRHRRRFQAYENEGEPWNEGEVYLSAKYSPWVVATLGFEYTGLQGQSPTYFNGSVTVKYTSDSNVRVLAGQQRGGLKCISGVCRQFPPFEGVKLEWTQRY